MENLDKVVREQDIENIDTALHSIDEKDDSPEIAFLTYDEWIEGFARYLEICYIKYIDIMFTIFCTSKKIRYIEMYIEKYPQVRFNNPFHQVDVGYKTLQDTEIFDHYRDKDYLMLQSAIVLKTIIKRINKLELVKLSVNGNKSVLSDCIIWVCSEYCS